MDAPQGTLSCATPQGAFSLAGSIHPGAIHLGWLLIQVVLTFRALPRLTVSNSALLPNCVSIWKSQFSNELKAEGRQIDRRVDLDGLSARRVRGMDTPNQCP